VMHQYNVSQRISDPEDIDPKRKILPFEAVRLAGAEEQLFSLLNVCAANMNADSFLLIEAAHPSDAEEQLRVFEVRTSDAPV